MTIDEQIAWIGSIQYWFQKNEGAENLQEVKESLRILKRLEVEKARLESELERMLKEEGKRWEMYQQFIDFYDQFCRAYIGVGAKLDGAQGKAMKAIITFLSKESKTKNEEGALLGWQYILTNWSKLTKFIQNQTALTQINKNLQEILTQLRRGSNEQAAKQNDIKGTRQRIIERRTTGTDNSDDRQP